MLIKLRSSYEIHLPANQPTKPGNDMNGKKIKKWKEKKINKKSKMCISVCGLTERLEHYSQWQQQHMWAGSVFKFLFNVFFCFHLVHSIATIDLIDRPIDLKSLSLDQHTERWSWIELYRTPDMLWQIIYCFLSINFSIRFRSILVSRLLLAFKTGEHWSLLYVLLYFVLEILRMRTSAVYSTHILIPCDILFFPFVKLRIGMIVVGRCEINILRMLCIFKEIIQDFGMKDQFLCRSTDFE